MLKVFIIEAEPYSASLLGEQREIRIVGGANEIGALGHQMSAADIVLVSARLPDAELAQLHELRATNVCIVITEIDETEEKVVSLLEGGAAGYVRREASAEEMVSTLYAIREGRPPIAPAIGTALVTRLHELLALQNQHKQESLTQDYADLCSLTAREREILTLIRGGASNQEIAEQLVIEVGTVKNHVHNILKKLNVTRRDQAARYVDLL